MAKLVFLGSGCWQGIPSQFCDDKVSKKVEWNTKDFRFRTSLLIETENDKSIVVEITPDIRLQAWKYKLKVPDVFLISHWHWDHMSGIQDLDWFFEKNSPIVYGNFSTKKRYDEKMSYIPLNFKVFKSHEPFVIDNIKITPFEVEHVKGTDGFIFENLTTGKKIAYLADFFNVPKKSLNLIRNVNTTIIDSVYLENEHGINGDKSHLCKKDLIDFLKKLDSENIILTHISSIHGLKHEDLVKKYPQYTISYDGMEINF